MTNTVDERLQALAQVMYNAWVSDTSNHHEHKLTSVDAKNLIDEIKRGLVATYDLAHAEGFVQGNRCAWGVVDISLNDLNKAVVNLNQIVERKNSEIFSLKTELYKAND